MNDILKNIAIIMLALGILGIILGISVGLYRNNAKANIQPAKGFGEELDEQALDESEQLDRSEEKKGLPRNNTLYEFLAWSNLHTAFLAAGTLLTVLSVVLLFFQH